MFFSALDHLYLNRRQLSLLSVMHFLAAFFASSLFSFSYAGPIDISEKHLASRSESAPNPIGAQYPNDVTGTLNSTIAVVPISYKLARSIIPAQYGILKKAYMSLLPGFPADKYPLIVRGAFDHEVGIYADNLLIADFQSIHISYPFVDVLGDGYSSFTYNKYLFITSTNAVALAGVASDGTTPVPATFSPELETYAYVPCEGNEKPKGEIYLNAYNNLSSTVPAVATLYKPQSSIGPYPLNFYVNITNQPITNAGITCDNQITLFNTTLSQGENAPVGIKGDIRIKAPYLPSDSTFKGVYGIKVDIAFVEFPGSVCTTLKGYSGTGPGD